MAGAAVFSCLERPQELKAHQLWKMRLRTFSEEHNISEEELKSLLHHYDEARTAGVHSERGRALWDFPGAFYFVGTVVSTIGFGVTAPSTGAGKVLLVFYGSLGCSAAILFFNLFLERLITSISLFMFWCHTRKSGPEDKNSERDSSDERKPSVYQITLLLLLVVLVVACSAASLYSPMEGWTYLESLYFCFVAFSTVGFGDFVSSQKEHHEDIRAYQMSNCLLMLLGVCCTYSLFNAISVIINKGLSWILIKVNWVFTSIKPNTPHIRPLFNLCFSDSESQTCCCENDSLMEPKRETSALSNQSTLDCSCVSHRRSFCNEVKVETICYNDKILSVEQEQDNYLYKNNVSVKPLPAWLN
ncbi:potassium channel subfamily K member 13 [Kryptolebias marmoratus]|uniref:potassium channel subfamily K member 13 n=1 Tax=Kryptolebias marmoratus TaxID=37003 RepID=UPI0018ACD2B1|nr:potassium channel subfamily K member 13 [Kryptolebias marmoratus]